MSDLDSRRSVPTYGDIRRAVEVIRPWVRRTPVLEVQVEVQVRSRPTASRSGASSRSSPASTPAWVEVRGAFTSVLSAP